MLTERRKGDREKLAAMVEKLCAEKGATCTRPDPLSPREIRLEIEMGELRVGIDFDGDQPASIVDNYCMPWNTGLYSKAKMTAAFGRAVGDEVNPFHRAKCMGFARGINALLHRLGAAMDCIKAGEAYEMPAETHPTAIAA